MDRVVNTITNNKVYSIFNSQYHEFVDFMMSKNVFSIGIAFIISQQVNDLFTNLMTNLFSPLIGLMIGGKVKNLEDVKITVRNSEFGIGKVIMKLLNFIIVLVLVFYMVKFLPIEKK